jgi:predicted polyphosphate/ATP-dependent NAD kinase
VARAVQGRAASRPAAGVGGRRAGRGGGGAIRTAREEIEALLRELDRLERDAAALTAALTAALDRAIAAEAEAEQRRYTRLVLAAWARRGAWRWN